MKCGKAAGLALVLGLCLLAGCGRQGPVWQLTVGQDTLLADAGGREIWRGSGQAARNEFGCYLVVDCFFEFLADHDFSCFNVVYVLSVQGRRMPCRTAVPSLTGRSECKKRTPADLLTFFQRFEVLSARALSLNPAWQVSRPERHIFIRPLPTIGFPFPDMPPGAAGSG